ncbi:MAG: threonylcarbamoyl-AMP synthase [Clostridiales bacterium]|nr:threonylcarbamoyl-AMP synthase [Clostridiales bacterium]
MHTQLLPALPEHIALGGKLLQSGQLVGFPTETVYGLGANALDAEAVRQIFIAKGRPQDNPLIVHVACPDDAESLCHVSSTARKLMDAFWPGPLTLVMPKKATVPEVTSAGLSSVGVRCPAHPVALALIRAAGVPVAAPSANTSGRPSPTCARHVYEDMQNRIPLILDGGDCQVGVESTVLSVTGDTPVILRPGKVTQLEIAQVTGKCLIADSVMRPLREGESAPSPGMKHRHYAPRGNMTIVQGTDEKKVVATLKRMYLSSENACILCHENLLAAFPGMRVFSLGNSPEDTARVLFSLLRDMDALKISRILCQGWDTGGVGLAVMNRMARAASFDIIEAE